MKKIIEENGFGLMGGIFSLAGLGLLILGVMQLESLKTMSQEASERAREWQMAHQWIKDRLLIKRSKYDCSFAGLDVSETSSQRWHQFLNGVNHELGNKFRGIRIRDAQIQVTSAPGMVSLQGFLSEPSKFVYTLEDSRGKQGVYEEIFYSNLLYPGGVITPPANPGNQDQRVVGRMCVSREDLAESALSALYSGATDFLVTNSQNNQVAHLDFDLDQSKRNFWFMSQAFYFQLCSKYIRGASVIYAPPQGQQNVGSLTCAGAGGLPISVNPVTLSPSSFSAMTVTTQHLAIINSHKGFGGMPQAPGGGVNGASP